ncbi:MAG: TetR/AcrR family transcriptional regulator [Patulibacter minatonensis]
MARSTLLCESGGVTSGRPIEPPQRRRVGRPPTLDREGALLAARTVIARRGIDRTRYSDVAEAAGVPVTTLQHAFGSLQAMLLESVSTAAASEIAVLRDLSHDSTLSAWERIQEFIRGAIDSPDDPDSWRVWLEFWRIASRDAEIGEDAGRIYEQWWLYLGELVQDGRDAGLFTSPITEDVRATAIALVGLIDGVAAALVLRADGPDHERTRAIVLAGAAAMLGVPPQPAN